MKIREVFEQEQEQFWNQLTKEKQLLVEWVSLEDAGLEDSPVWDTVCAAQLQYFRDEA